MSGDNSQMVNITHRVFLWPLSVALIVVLLNMQWLELYHLLNAPQADSLVYLTEAYNDYWAMRNLEFQFLFEKYVVSGNQHVSPLLWWFAALSFFIFGLDPANAYMVIALAYLVWVSGVVFLAWQVLQDRQYAIACGLLAAFLPSVVIHGLRHFMLDFVAAAPFIWSTAFLIKSDLLVKRRDVLIYSGLVAITVLFRTTSIVYFISHIAILIIQAIMRKRHPHYRNMILAALIVTLGCGWFIFPNLQRILDYYGYWASEASIANPDISFVSNMKFYFEQVAAFHMPKGGGSAVLALTGVAISILSVKLYFQKDARGVLTNEWLEKILTIVALALVPTICLSFYSSRAPSVDYPFVAAYLLFPLFLWRTVFIKTNWFWLPVMMLVLTLGYTQTRFLIGSPPMTSGNNDFREREVLRVIFADAEKQGLNAIKLGNTSIHQHNSLSYQYWTLVNYFPRWRGRLTGVPIGRTGAPETLAKMNSSADYVITLENYQAKWHPNNRAAPAANRLLVEHYGMRALPVQFALPDGTTLKILARQESLRYPFASFDGWYENGVVVKIRNPEKKSLAITVEGSLSNLAAKQGPATLTLYSKDNRMHRLSFIAPSDTVDHTFLVPSEFFDADGNLNLILESTWAVRPSEIS
ncbi:MAG: hypothetical protein P8N92_02820, partial [Burkholderiales bacterium]|nr:hypothetical protein [Burkholderiales bacterium]